MATPAEIEAAIALYLVDSDKFHDIVHGGVGASVVTEGGTVPSIAKAIADATASIITAHAAGFVAVTANSASRAALAPAQIGQLLIQLDNFNLFYSDSMTVGDWNLHPAQTAANDATTALAGIATLTTAVGLKMTSATYVGGGASGDVRTSERIREIVTKIADDAGAGQHFYGSENAGYGLMPLLNNVAVTALPDGSANHSALANTSRHNQGPGTGFALVGNPKRLVAWGSNFIEPVATPIITGRLGTGINATVGYKPRFSLFTQQPDRNLPDFDPATLLTSAGQVQQIIALGSAALVRTGDGIICVAGGKSLGVKSLFGSNVDKTQLVFMPIYFNLSAVAKSIRLFDAVDPIANETTATAIYVDEDEHVWITTSNPATAGYGNSLVGAQNIPVNITPGFAGWAGKIVQKVRCDGSGNIYILFTDGDLWAGGGKNTTGQLGTGSTSDVLNPLSIASGVDDFEVSGDVAANLALFTLQGGTLKGAGYNANGQLNRGNTTSSSSFVTIDTNVDFVRIGGTDNVTVIWKTTGDVWKATGRNTDGGFGKGGSNSTVNHTATTLTDLATLIDANDGFEELIISGYSTKHATCVLCTNGKAFTAGNNTDGCLGNGNLTAQNTWQEVLWPARDAYEILSDVSSAVGSNAGPAFMFLTSYGRLLLAGSTAYGFATGRTQPATHQMLSAQPIEFSTL